MRSFWSTPYSQLLQLPCRDIHTARSIYGFQEIKNRLYCPEWQIHLSHLQTVPNRPWKKNNCCQLLLHFKMPFQWRNKEKRLLLQVLFGADKFHVKTTETQMPEYLYDLDGTKMSVRLCIIHHPSCYLKNSSSQKSVIWLMINLVQVNLQVVLR